MEVRIKKLSTAEEIKQFWKKKREYERKDVFPNLEESGEELQEIINWFNSQEYYDIIMGLSSEAKGGGDPLQFVFFYDEKQNYLGFTMYKIYIQEDGKAFILDYCIAPSFRNKGIGKLVFKKLEELLYLEGGKYVALNASNKNNRRFWQQNGFEATVLDENDELVYVKRAIG
ncbi:GNAT family N-acetyltransferase [Enterococcus sp. JM9B]|nr:GNAT family N-acetyltransferase [Enterococcus sp. JM9B]KAF1300812.1 acetyltransferase [Enterococcus sp. JM9B]